MFEYKLVMNMDESLLFDIIKIKLEDLVISVTREGDGAVVKTGCNTRYTLLR